MLITVSCHGREGYEKKTFSLNTYERFEQDGSRKYLQLTVLKVYAAATECTGSEKYANLYVTTTSKGQRLYVFEYCKKVPDLVFDTTGRYVPLIDTSDILKGRQDKVNIFVPKDFSIPAGAKYLFAELSVLTES